MRMEDGRGLKIEEEQERKKSGGWRTDSGSRIEDSRGTRIEDNRRWNRNE